MNKPTISNEQELMLALLDQDVKLTNFQWGFIRLLSEVAKDNEIVVNGKHINFADQNPDYFYYHIHNYVMWMINNKAFPTNEEITPFFSGQTTY
jgi:hypothetical protein